tara:strand:+ start:1649 stop:2089 length:441 start_codon:yes stop_codon:yes gene_type:complete
MSEVFKIGIAKSNNQNINEVKQISVLAGKGIVGDLHFHEYNDARKQLTLIESENIDYYNKNFNLNIPYLNFKRNIVTKGIQLNDLVGKKLFISNVELNAIELCRPCKNLQEILGQDNIIKEFLRKGGLRCEILNNGIISIGDPIKV